MSSTSSEDDPMSDIEYEDEDQMLDEEMPEARPHNHLPAMGAAQVVPTPLNGPFPSQAASSAPAAAAPPSGLNTQTTGPTTRASTATTATPTTTSTSGIVRPFTCTFPQCDRAFTTNQNLVHHLATHGPPEFICQLCPGKRYYQRKGLLDHTRKYHRDQHLDVLALSDDEMRNRIPAAPATASQAQSSYQAQTVPQPQLSAQGQVLPQSWATTQAQVLPQPQGLPSAQPPYQAHTHAEFQASAQAQQSSDTHNLAQRGSAPTAQMFSIPVLPSFAGQVGPPQAYAPSPSAPNSSHAPINQLPPNTPPGLTFPQQPPYYTGGTYSLPASATPTRTTDPRAGYHITGPPSPPWRASESRARAAVNEAMSRDDILRSLHGIALDRLSTHPLTMTAHARVLHDFHVGLLEADYMWYLEQEDAGLQQTTPPWRLPGWR